MSVESRPSDRWSGVPLPGASDDEQPPAPGSGTLLAPACLLLVQDLLERGLPWSYRELSHSMLPTIRPYDVVQVRPVGGSRLAVGDVVALLVDGRLRVHRLVEQSGGESVGELVTRGDALSQPDPPAPVSSLLGRVECVRRGGRRQRVHRGRRGLWQAAAGRLRRSMWRRLRSSWKMCVQGGAGAGEGRPPAVGSRPSPEILRSEPVRAETSHTGTRSMIGSRME